MSSTRTAPHTSLAIFRHNVEVDSDHVLITRMGSQTDANAKLSDLGEPVDSILKHDHPVPNLWLLAAACPIWMLGGIYVSLGMWHQPKDSSTSIANASDVCVSPIRIMRKRQNVVLNTALPAF